MVLCCENHGTAILFSLAKFAFYLYNYITEKKQERKKGTVSFNGTLNTFYLRFYSRWNQIYGKGTLR